ncbi:MAG: hypothetical protein HDS95_04680 [Bacteroidales bacterium]|nr:hypothetical protein [Bacteroidales bacterium]
MRKFGGFRPVGCLRKDTVFSDGTEKWGGSLRASAYCHGAKCSMTILPLPESWGKEKDLTAVKMLSDIEPLSILRKLGGSRPVDMRKLGGSCPVDSEIKDENIWLV